MRAQDSVSREAASDETPRVELLIFQTTPFCNINCSYCYLPNRQAKERILPSVVSRVTQSVLDAGWIADQVTVVWHAGEPLVVGPDCLEHLMDACAPLCQNKIRVQQYVQTNAMLINDRFCELFLRKHVRIGVSIDGPRDLHDRSRVTRAGAGTFDKVVRGIAKLRDFGIGFDVICVLTLDSLHRAEELYEFFSKLGASTVGFNVDEIEGANSSSSMNQQNFFESLSKFWDAMFRVHFKQRAFRLRESDDLLEAIRYGRPGEKGNLLRPFSIVTVAVDGSIGTFSPELLGQRDHRYGDFAIGNICSETMTQIAASPRFLRMRAEIEAGVRRCFQECAYFQVCGGGAPSNKIAEHGTFDATETKHCRATKMVIVDSLLRAAKPYQSNGPVVH
ncbi:MAG TPA: cyclophane-forming radical SAM/SPASM peptide maturase GrrM/OscB [Terriglobia bacterium]|nr:cyclophane-forming radical SAM/SPASM peptide maturase GrrM/OscB [Terriglobia bacterium]